MSYRFPLGIQTFEKIRSAEYLYVDKTDFIRRLVDDGEYYFLARPRRFGKSLLLSTIEAYFCGKAHLFKGLSIDTPDTDWTPHEVIHIDLSAKEYNSDQSLREFLQELMLAYETKEDVFAPLSGLSVERRLANVITHLYSRSGRPVVILIDEYDKPLLDAIDNPGRLEAFRSLLKAFYAQLKSMDRYIRFVMMSGVTKFGKASIFSDLNNLNDISADPEYADICGLTRAEIAGALPIPLKDFADADGLSEELALEKLEQRYGGYAFAPNAPKVFNPLSVLTALKKRRWGDYWFASGTPAILIDALMKSRFPLNKLTETPVTLAALNSILTPDADPIPLFYQSGYLTLDSYSEASETCTLRFPNLEVERCLLEFILPSFSSCGQQEARAAIDSLAAMLHDNNVDGFMLSLKSMIADTAYMIVPNADKERYYHTFFYLLVKLLGYSAHCEYTTLAGRIDLTVETDSRIFIFEFKLDSSPREAIEQIERKGYRNPFITRNKEIVEIGVNFSSDSKTIDSWQVKKVSSFGRRH